MIKMGDFQQNMQSHQSLNTFHFTKSMNKQLSDLCSRNNQTKTSDKNNITKRAKLFVNSKFEVIKNVEKNEINDL